jgi:phage shock protein PspC (stress-responsive transcriptional regulator)
MSTFSNQGGRSLVRPRDSRMIAGVCAGLARRFDISVTLVRLLFLLFIILPIPSVIVYVVLWVIMPNDS